MRIRSLGIKLLMLAITLFLLAYFGLQAVNYLENPLTTTLAYAYSVDQGVEISGYLVRREQVLPGDAGTLLRLQRAEGERVSAGGTVAMVYADQASFDRQSEIDGFTARIEQLEYVQEAAYSYEAIRKLDAQISKSILDLRTALSSDRLDLADRQGSELRALVLKQDYTDTDTQDVSAQLETLRQELRALRSQSAGSIRRINAPAAGLYSAVVDGYESLLTPESVQELTPSQLSALRPDSSLISDVGKLVLGDSWYYAASLRASEIKELQEAGALSLRFSKGVDRDLPVTIQWVGEEENGRSLVLFQGKTYLSQLTLLRQQSAQVIHSTIQGLRVPTEALRVLTETIENEDGTVTERQTTGLYCILGARARFKPVEILYNGEGFLLVRAASDQSNRLLRIGDEVILTANDLYDGKVVRNTQ